MNEKQETILIWSGFILVLIALFIMGFVILMEKYIL